MVASNAAINDSSIRLPIRNISDLDIFQSLCVAIVSRPTLNFTRLATLAECDELWLGKADPC